MTDVVRNYRDLKVWQKGIELVKEVYTLIRKFPKYETYGLADQMRRSSVSVPSNIAQRIVELRKMIYTLISRLPTTH